MANTTPPRRASGLPETLNLCWGLSGRIMLEKWVLKGKLNMAEIGILNCGEGDTKLTFNKDDPAEMLRAKRIITDMLRRGYALLVETGEKDSQGRPMSTRIYDFDETKCEYIVADFDSEVAAEADRNEQAGQAVKETARETGRKPGSGRRQTRRVPADKSRVVAVPRIAGG